MITFSAEATKVNDQHGTGQHHGTGAGHGTSGTDDPATEALFAFDDCLSHDDIWSEETVALRAAYYQAIGKDVAKAMIENVNSKILSEYLGVDENIIED